MRKKTVIAAIALFAIALFSGCSTLIDAIGDAADSVLNADARSAEPEEKKTPAESSPEQESTSEWDFEMELQAQIVFNFAFSGGGFWLSDAEYKEGEYTIFEWILEEGDVVNMEKAFLKELDDGSRWWRVGWTTEDQAIVFETLINAEQNQVVRLRARDNDGKTEEVKLTGQTLYVPPNRLEDEEVEAITKGNEQIETKAGSFQAKHLAFKLGEGPGRMEWWTTEKVPGLMVKYQFVDSNGGIVWSASLAEYGKKAESTLDSF